MKFYVVFKKHWAGVVEAPSEEQLLDALNETPTHELDGWTDSGWRFEASKAADQTRRPCAVLGVKGKWRAPEDPEP